MAIRVTVWNEFTHEKNDPEARAQYPDGIHVAVRDFLSVDSGLTIRTATLDQPACGLPDEVLFDTDVLVWWGHMRHADVDDATVERIRRRVYAGMGFVALHSAHHSKPFRAILGTTGNLTWGREQKALVWNLAPTHPIAAGLPSHFELFEEMYGEPFFIPRPDDVIFGTWYEDGNLFRGGCTWTCGLGRVFYFHPGHETCASFHHPLVQEIIRRGVRWAAPAPLDPSLSNTCVHQIEAPASTQK
ncbi:MAG: ThuA domain-containing protein [Clostridia bacterium]|nr:ThuA domain-containing protein [Clostridia bacterium]